MSAQNYAVSFTVDESPQAVFDAINDVRGWWSEAEEGDTDRLGGVFYHHYQDVHRCTLKVTELVPGKKVVWHVLHNDFNFIRDRTEWNGTDVVFEIARNGGQTELRFTHQGLVPDYECYDVCSNAWGQYITGSLCKLITTGKGEPNPAEGHAEHQEEVVSKVREQGRKLEGVRR